MIPNILKSVLPNENILKVFGDDYPTYDETCVRDYVHVTDLAQAYLLGLENMEKGKGFSSFNLGNGNGFSVLEVIESCERAENVEVTYKIDGRREGDPPSLVADSNKAKESLVWKPKFGSLDSIISSALKCHREERGG